MNVLSLSTECGWLPLKKVLNVFFFHLRGGNKTECAEVSQPGPFNCPNPIPSPAAVICVCVTRPRAVLLPCGFGGGCHSVSQSCLRCGFSVLVGPPEQRTGPGYAGEAGVLHAQAWLRLLAGHPPKGFLYSLFTKSQ